MTIRFGKASFACLRLHASMPRDVKRGGRCVTQQRACGLVCVCLGNADGRAADGSHRRSVCTYIHATYNIQRDMHMCVCAYEQHTRVTRTEPVLDVAQSTASRKRPQPFMSHSQPSCGCGPVETERRRYDRAVSRLLLPRHQACISKRPSMHVTHHIHSKYFEGANPSY